MACRVFRLLKLGLLKTSPEPFRPSAVLPSNIVNMNLATIQFNVPTDGGSAADLTVPSETMDGSLVR